MARKQGQYVECIVRTAKSLNATLQIDLGFFPVANKRTGNITNKQQFATVSLPDADVSDGQQAIEWLTAQEEVNVKIPANAQADFVKIRPVNDGKTIAVFAAARNGLDMPEGMTQEEIDTILEALDLDRDGKRLKKTVPVTPSVTPSAVNV